MEPRAQGISRSPSPPWPGPPSGGFHRVRAAPRTRPRAPRCVKRAAHERPGASKGLPQMSPDAPEMLQGALKTLPKRPEAVFLYIFCRKMQVNGSPKYIKNQSRSHHCETAPVLQKRKKKKTSEKLRKSFWILKGSGDPRQPLHFYIQLGMASILQKDFLGFPMILLGFP